MSTNEPEDKAVLALLDAPHMLRTGTGVGAAEGEMEVVKPRARAQSAVARRARMGDKGMLFEVV